MKKALLLFLSILLLAVPVNAAYFDLKKVDLKDSSGTLLEDYSLTSGSAVTTNWVNVQDNVGFMALEITEDQSGGTGDVDISAEYSWDRTNWFTFAVSNMSGVITEDGLIAQGFGNDANTIQFTARPAPFVRFIFDPDANSEITVKLIYQKDN